MIELDEYLKPTGRILFKDLDFTVDQGHYAAFNPGALTDELSQVVEKGVQPHTFALFNGTDQLPSWLSKTEYRESINSYSRVQAPI